MYCMYEVSQGGEQYNSANNTCKSTVLPLKAWAAMLVVPATLEVVIVTVLVSNSSPTGIVELLEVVLHVV